MSGDKPKEPNEPREPDSASDDGLDDLDETLPAVPESGAGEAKDEDRADGDGLAVDQEDVRESGEIDEVAAARQHDRDAVDAFELGLEDDSADEGSSFATRRPVAVSVVFLAAVVFGSFSLGRLPVNLMPELSYPTLTVRTEYAGAAPEEVENDISRPVEEALGVVGGLSQLSSISRAGVSDVVLEFTWDTNISDATQDVLERLDLVFLPPEADQPLILHYDPSLDPVMELSLSGSGDRFSGEEGLRRLRRLSDLQVKRAIEPIKGIAAVRVRGGLEEEIHVLVDGEALRRVGLPVQAVIDRLQQENVNVAGGTIKEGTTEYMVRTLNEYTDLDQIRNTILRTSQDGRDVRLSDVAQVEWSQKERQINTRTDGSESVQIDIFKEADANIVSLAKSVKAAIGEFDFDKPEVAEAAAPTRGPPGRGRGGRGGPGDDSSGLAETLFKAEGARLKVVADRSLFIESSIREVQWTALLGGILAILVLFLFLRNLRSTMIVAVSIPVSILITFAPLNLFGVTLNIMSLGGLALGIGMLVDSSIVVLESIFRRREEGDGVEAAAVTGTQEVRGAVIASTLTSIAVFFPMVFVEGIAGQAFGDLGTAVVVSLMVSVLVAIYLIPMLASRTSKIGDGDSAPSPFKTLFRIESIQSLRDEPKPQGFVRKILRLGTWIFRICLVPAEVLVRLIIGIVLVLVLGFQKFLLPVIRVILTLIFKLPLWVTNRVMEFFLRIYPPVLRGSLRSPAVVLVLTAAVLAFTAWMFTSIDTELLPEVHQGEITFEVAMPVGTPIEETEAILSPIEAAVLEDREHIESLIVTYGFDAANSQRSDEGEHSARFKLVLDTADPRVEKAVVERVRQKLESVPDLEARVTRPVLFSSKTPIEVEIHGDDLVQLKRLAQQARSEMASLPQLGDVETTLKSGAPEVQIIYDRERLMRYGLNLRQTADLVRNQVKGFEATSFNRQDRRIPILVRLQEVDRETVGDVRAMVVNPSGHRPIPLSAVSEVSLGEGPSEVRRIDGQRVAVINANIASGSLSGAVEAIREKLSSSIDWPADTTFFLTGQNEEWERSKGSLWLALGLSIFLVYVIMAAQFESLVQPFVIMFSIPLAFFGTGLALKMLNINLSVVVLLGMIMLAGIVVNNAIVLVDYVNTLRRRGLDRDEAVVTAGTVRLRPILMTTATTVLGLLPMALGLGDGAEIRTPMAMAVISGLITSTFLTLLVIPSLYSLVDRLLGAITGRSEGRSTAGSRSASPSPASTQIASPAMSRERTV